MWYKSMGHFNEEFSFYFLIVQETIIFSEMLSTESWNSFKKINQNGSESKPICPRQKTATTGEFV